MTTTRTRRCDGPLLYVLVPADPLFPRAAAIVECTGCDWLTLDPARPDPQHVTTPVIVVE